MFRTGRNRHYKFIVAKYGSENIQVSIIPCESEDHSFSLEIQLIKVFRMIGYELVNYTDGGEGASGRPMSADNKAKLLASSRKGKRLGPQRAEHIAKRVAANRAKTSWNKGIPPSAESIAKRTASSL
jgi:hypothetical protein